MKAKQTYYELIKRIKNQGESRPKRHGQYIKLNVFGDYSLELDTWNKSITVFKSDKRVDNLGIDFGGFRCNLAMTKFWIAHIPKIL